MLLIAAVYLLLATRVHVYACAGLCGRQGSVQAELRVSALALRFDACIAPGKGGAPLAIAARYARRKQPKAPAKERISALRTAWPYALAALRAGRFEHLGLDMRLGLGEAWSTAVAAGAAKAGISALLSSLGQGAPCDLHIEPDFQSSCILLSARCIFSASPGDIMFAVMKAALKKSGKEGFRWKSIPLKA